MRREQYSPEVIAQASLEVAQDPQLGNTMLAARTREVAAIDQKEAFWLVFRALGGRQVMERAERIARERTKRVK